MKWGVTHWESSIVLAFTAQAESACKPQPKMTPGMGQQHLRRACCVRCAACISALRSKKLVAIMRTSNP